MYKVKRNGLVMTKFDKKFKNIKTLIIDDGDSTRKVLHYTLKEIGLKSINNVPNGEAGIKAIKKSLEEKNPYQLVFCDINMPGISGVEVLKQIREFDPQGQIIVLVISSIRDMDTILEVADLGACNFIHKPFNTQDIEEKIVDALKDFD